jgi:hypothetical protein
MNPTPAPEPVAYQRFSKISTAETAIDLVDLKSQSKNYNDGMVSTKLFPFVAVILVFSLGLAIAGVPGFVHNLHRTIRRREPSATDLKVAKVVGYRGLFFGTAALIQGLIQLIR